MHLAIYPRRVESFMLRSGILEVFPFGVRALSMILFHKVSFFYKRKFLQPGKELLHMLKMIHQTVFLLWNTKLVTLISSNCNTQRQQQLTRLQLQIGIQSHQMELTGWRDAHSPHIDGGKFLTALTQCNQSCFCHMTATP